MHHKVNTFIIKNPPNLNPAVQGSSLTEGKRSKRSKKGAENGDSANTTATEGDASTADIDIQVPNVVTEEVNWRRYKYELRLLESTLLIVSSTQQQYNIASMTYFLFPLL